MTNDTATKIAALVAELARLRDEVKSLPTDEQRAQMRTICTAEQAGSACMAAMGMLAVAEGNIARELFDVVMLATKALALVHKDADKREVSSSEVLRALADHLDKSEEFINKLKRAFEAIGVKPPAESEPPPSKPGAN